MYVVMHFKSCCKPQDDILRGGILVIIIVQELTVHKMFSSHDLTSASQEPHKICYM